MFFWCANRLQAAQPQKNLVSVGQDRAVRLHTRPNRGAMAPPGSTASQPSPCDGHKKRCSCLAQHTRTTWAHDTDSSLSTSRQSAAAASVWGVRLGNKDQRLQTSICDLSSPFQLDIVITGPGRNGLYFARGNPHIEKQGEPFSQYRQCRARADFTQDIF